MVEDEKVETPEEARAFLSSTFTVAYEQARSRIATTDIQLLEDAKECADKSILTVNILGPVEKRQLWEKFMEEFYRQGIPLVEILVRRLTSEQLELFAHAKGSREVLSLAQGLLYLHKGGIFEDLAISGYLVACVSDLREILKFYKEKPDQDMINFLDEFVELLRKRDLPSKSFLILKEVKEKMLIIGVDVEDGHLEHVGIAELAAPCRVGRFRNYYYDDNLRPKLPEGKFMIVEVNNKVEDYLPDALFNPYLYPDDLFLMQCATNERWDAFGLTESGIGQEIKAYIEG